MKSDLIGVSGKLGSGKDTVGLIIQCLHSDKDYTTDMIANSIRSGLVEIRSSPWQIKKMAGKLKDIACILLGCTRAQLEDRKYKEKELGEEWWYWKDLIHGFLFPYNNYGDIDERDRVLIKLTPRLLMQLLGTECGRDILHPNIWANSLFSTYKPTREKYTDGNSEEYREVLPKWIVTDMRFPNEFDAIKSRGGITIRVERPGMESHCGEQHPSETALDSAEFDIVINNDGTLEELIEKIKELKLI